MAGIAEKTLVSLKMGYAYGLNIMWRKRGTLKLGWLVTVMLMVPIDLAGKGPGHPVSACTTHLLTLSLCPTQQTH